MAGGRVFVVNAGSSSLKYEVFDVSSGTSTDAGSVSGVGAGLATSTAAEVATSTRCSTAPATRRPSLRPRRHWDPRRRALHPARAGRRQRARGTGGPRALAPLHNPANTEGNRRSRETFTDVPQVAVFDTAFHASIPPEAHTVDVNSVILHLGNCASECAVRGGRSVDTSMGLTPVEGLVMGTRSGNVDPALGGYLSRVARISAKDYDQTLTRASGLLGLCGVSDFRELTERRGDGDPAATLAFDVTVHRLVKYVGAYAAVLGRADALVFTGGIGENSPVLRAAVLGRLGILAVGLDARANAGGPPERRVSTSVSRTQAWVVPTDEESQIARATLDLLGVEHRLR